MINLMENTTNAQENSAQDIPRQKVTFDKFTQDGFQKDVNRRVDEFFHSNNISKHANSQMILKTAWILIGWLGTYLLIMSNLISPPGMLALALAHGFFTAMIGLNISHDAIHGSYTKCPKKNKKLGLSFNFIGVNDYVWNISHNIVHHTYTNIPEHDEDIEQIGILRLQPNQELKKIHRFQYIYAFFLYSLSTFFWVLLKDYKKFFQHQLGGHYRKTFPKKEMFRLFFYKALYYFLFLVLPILVLDIAWYWVVFGFVMSHLLEGFLVSVIFMLAHIVEDTEFPEPCKEGKMNMPWADLQLHTTSNFAINNRVVNYLFGGLNFQVEHHLFPKVCHIHYPKIAQIVKQTAKDHNLPYLEQETFFGAIGSHVRFLKKYGTAQA